MLRYISIVSVLCLIACHDNRSSSPQSGPIVGTWKFAGDEPKEALSADSIRTLAIGTDIWKVARETTFSKAGTVNSVNDSSCSYWIVSESKLRLGCGKTTTLISYKAERHSLSLTLDGENTSLSGGGPNLQFERIG